MHLFKVFLFFFVLWKCSTMASHWPIVFEVKMLSARPLREEMPLAWQVHRIWFAVALTQPPFWNPTVKKKTYFHCRKWRVTLWCASTQSVFDWYLCTFLFLLYIICFFLWQKLHCLYLRFPFLFSLCCCCVGPQLTRVTLLRDHGAVISATQISLSAATHGNVSRCWPFRFHYFVRLVVFIQICFIYVFCFTRRTIEFSQRSANRTPRIAQVGHARFVPLWGSHFSSSLFSSSGSIFYLKDGSSLRWVITLSKFCFLPRNCSVGGTNSHSPFRRCSEFFFEAPPPPFVESSALLCKPTRLEVVPSCRESFFSPADGFRRPDVREPMPGRCRDYALLSFILPSSRCPFSPLPICSVSPVFSKPPPPLGFPPQVPLPPMSSPQFLKGSFGYRSSSTRLPCAVCTDYRCYYWELSSMYLWYAYFFFSRLFWGNKTVLLCRFFSICGNVAVVPKLEVRSNCTRIFVPVWRSYLWPITFIVFFSSTLIFYKNIRYEMKCTYTQSQ